MLAMTERTSKDSDDLCMRLLTNGKGCFMIWEEVENVMDSWTFKIFMKGSISWKIWESSS